MITYEDSWMPNQINPALLVSLRSHKGEQVYSLAKQAGKTKELKLIPSLHEWKYWRLVENEFPYDAIFKTHHMLVVKRSNVAERFSLSDNERQEFEDILREYVYPKYSVWFENVPATRTVPTHYHVHLGLYYDKRSDMKL